MIFNSLSYLAFLPTVVVIFHALGRRGRQWLLLIASYGFYAAWDWRFCGLLALSTVVDFTVGQRLRSRTIEPAVVGGAYRSGSVDREGAGTKREPSARVRRGWLALSVLVNLGVLATFKYAAFFAESLRDLLADVGLKPGVGTLELVLPVGISFYTFQTMAYTIDCYRGRIEPERDVVVFAIYVAFFPQLVAGPIERAQRLLPQLRAVDGRLDADRLMAAVTLIAVGLVKKVVLADQLAPIVDQSFDGTVTTVGAVVGAVAFAGQIYGDFSGYTDIARGSSRLLGIELVENFERPYLSNTVTEFWRRWHISLSQWLRDYLYIPIGGNRGTPSATSRNLLVTMMLGGLWHGAAWTFVVWGGLHGCYLLVERRVDDERVRGPRWVRWLITTSAVLVAWVFFRAPDIATAVDYLGGLFDWGGWTLGLDDSIWLTVGLGGLALHDALRPRTGGRWVLEHPLAAGGFVALVGVAVTAVSGTESVPFIYFQF